MGRFLSLLSSVSPPCLLLPNSLPSSGLLALIRPFRLTGYSVFSNPLTSNPQSLPSDSDTGTCPRNHVHSSRTSQQSTCSYRNLHYHYIFGATSDQPVVSIDSSKKFNGQRQKSDQFLLRLCEPHPHTFLWERHMQREREHPPTHPPTHTHTHTHTHTLLLNDIFLSQGCDVAVFFQPPIRKNHMDVQCPRHPMVGRRAWLWRRKTRSNNCRDQFVNPTLIFHCHIPVLCSVMYACSLGTGLRYEESVWSWAGEGLFQSSSQWGTCQVSACNSFAPVIIYPLLSSTLIPDP